MVNHTAKTQIPQSLTAGVFNGRGIFDFGAKNEAYADYFTGTSYLALLNQPGLIVANVTFEPGCRNFWHIHHEGGQILLVTGGRGGIKNVVSQRKRSTWATSCILHLALSIGTAQLKIAGFHM